MDVAAAYLEYVRTQFEKMKKLAEGAIAQAKDDELVWRLDPEANSLALIMRHMAGNLRSRFTDFLTTDGEKPNRNRDGEFEESGQMTRGNILDDWESGWRVLFEAAGVSEGEGDEEPRDAHAGRRDARRVHPRRAAHGDAGAGSPIDPPLVSRGADRVPGEAPAIVGVANAVDTSQANLIVNG